MPASDETDDGVSDEDLLLAYYSGSDLAISSLMTRHYNRTERVARKYLDSDEAAEDVAMDAWIAIAHTRDRLAPKWDHTKGPVLRWILRITINNARSHVRRRDAKSRKGIGKDLEINAPHGDSGQDFAEFYLGRSPDPMKIVTEAADAEDFKAKLTSQEQVYIELTMDYGYTPGEVAAILEVKPSRVTAIRLAVQGKWKTHCAEQDIQLLQQEGR
jgi:RNA polymerase sigma factor (sigma-70 family)